MEKRKKDYIEKIKCMDEFYSSNKRLLNKDEKYKKINYNWISDQRKLKSTKLIKPAYKEYQEWKIKQLEKKDYWRWNDFDYRWNKMYLVIKKLSKILDINTLQLEKFYDNIIPGNERSPRKWLDDQNETYKKGKLSEEKIRKLEDIGYVFNKKSRKKIGNIKCDEDLIKFLTIIGIHIKNNFKNCDYDLNNKLKYKFNLISKFHKYFRENENNKRKKLINKFLDCKHDGKMFKEILYPQIQSEGEKLIERLLKSFKEKDMIKNFWKGLYIKEYNNFTTCNRPLQLDFIIELKDHTLLSIEFDGQQHFFKCSRFHKSNDDFKCQIMRDRKKDEYIINNTRISKFNNRYINSLFRIHFSFIEINYEEQEKTIINFINNHNDKICYCNNYK